MPAVPVILTDSQRAVLDYLRWHSAPVDAVVIARHIYGVDRSGVANTVRAMSVLHARGLVRPTGRRSTPVAAADLRWTTTAKGRRA